MQPDRNKNKLNLNFGDATGGLNGAQQWAELHLGSQLKHLSDIKWVSKWNLQEILAQKSKREFGSWIMQVSSTTVYEFEELRAHQLTQKAYNMHLDILRCNISTEGFNLPVALDLMKHKEQQDISSCIHCHEWVNTKMCLRSGSALASEGHLTDFILLHSHKWNLRCLWIVTSLRACEHATFYSVHLNDTSKRLLALQVCCAEACLIAAPLHLYFNVTFLFLSQEESTLQRFWCGVTTASYAGRKACEWGS